MSLGIHSGMNWQEGFGISEMSCYISSIIPCRRLASVTCLNWPTCIQHEQHSHLPCPEYRTMNTTHEQNNPAAALRQQDCHDWRDILVPSPWTGDGNIRECYCNRALYTSSNLGYLYLKSPPGFSDTTPNSIPNSTPNALNGARCLGCGRSCILHF